MADQVQIRRNSTAGLGSFVAAQGELIMNTTTNALYVGNGAASPGIQVGGGANGAFGSTIQMYVLEGSIETIGAGSTYSTTVAVPAYSLLLGASYYIETAITMSGGSSFSFGLNAIGTGSAQPALFGNTLGLAAGSRYSPVCAPQVLYGSAVHLLLTATAGTFTGGTVRFAVQYIALTAPSS
jgi:hypothetical protein